MTDQEAAAVAVTGLANIIGVCVGLAIGMAIWGAIAYCLNSWLSRIPPQHRKQEPGMVWLIIIPFVNLVWSFFVFPKIAESFQSYFAEQGDTSVGDCGKQLSLYFCICYLLNIVPGLNCIMWIPALILLVMVMLKFSELKNKIAVV